MTVTYKQGDRLPSLNVTAIQSDGTAYDLTGATVVFSLRNTDTGTVVVDRASATLVSGPNGQVRYDWAANDLATVGHYEAEFEASISGRKLSIPTAAYIPVRVIERIG